MKKGFCIFFRRIFFKLSWCVDKKYPLWIKIIHRKNFHSSIFLQVEHPLISCYFNKNYKYAICHRLWHDCCIPYIKSGFFINSYLLSKNTGNSDDDQHGSKI